MMQIVAKRGTIERPKPQMMKKNFLKTKLKRKQKTGQFFTMHYSPLLRTLKEFIKFGLILKIWEYSTENKLREILLPLGEQRLTRLG